MGGFGHRKSELHSVTTREHVTLSLCRHHFAASMRVKMQAGPLGALKIALPRAKSRCPVSDILFIPPDTTVDIEVAAGEFETLPCFFPRDILEKAGWDGSAQAHGVQLDSPLIKADFRRLLEMLLDPALEQGGFVEAATKLILLEVMREIANRQQNVELRPGGLTAWRHGRIRRRLASDGEPVPSVAELAELCGITPRHLTRAYRIDTGECIGDVIRRVMVERAKRKLVAQSPIKCIAADLGFSSTASFSVAFAREVGMRPTQFRGTLSVTPH
ncbi:helix-turn-helix domain-containing protein [Sphingomonas sp.]|uniref:helix-turn-helix domain-containing protein n=1 Tax=Sphingomonas sp. TaxID=28214 RepID=UPI003F6FACAF